MEFEKDVPRWDNPGAEPPDDLLENGFVAGYKPPAGYFNWFFNKISLAVKEIREKMFSGSYNDLTNKPTSLKNPYALTVNGKSYTGESAVNAGTQGIAYGGTGATTAAEARTNIGAASQEDFDSFAENFGQVGGESQCRKFTNVYYKYVPTTGSSKKYIAIKMPNLKEYHRYTMCLDVVSSQNTTNIMVSFTFNTQNKFFNIASFVENDNIVLSLAFDGGNTPYIILSGKAENLSLTTALAINSIVASRDLTTALVNYEEIEGIEASRMEDITDFAIQYTHNVNVGLNAEKVNGSRFTVTESAPSNPDTRDLWIYDDFIRRYDGTNWIDIISEKADTSLKLTIRNDGMPEYLYWIEHEENAYKIKVNYALDFEGYTGSSSIGLDIYIDNIDTTKPLHIQADLKSTNLDTQKGDIWFEDADHVEILSVAGSTSTNKLFGTWSIDTSQYNLIGSFIDFYYGDAANPNDPDGEWIYPDFRGYIKIWQ